jgi:hypothetical protein
MYDEQPVRLIDSKDHNHIEHEIKGVTEIKGVGDKK